MQPDIAAPGVKILAAVAPDEKTTTNTTFRFQSGTSMATPHISGIVALLKSLHPDWSPAAIKSAVITTGTILARYQYHIHDLDVFESLKKHLIPA